MRQNEPPSFTFYFATVHTLVTKCALNIIARTVQDLALAQLFQVAKNSCVLIIEFKCLPYQKTLSPVCTGEGPGCIICNSLDLFLCLRMELLFK